jgi:peptide/nickel transport system permease protein
MSALAFLAIKLVPADPAVLAAGPGAQPAQVEELRRRLGLDQSLWIQYARYFNGLIHFDLGTSLITGRPIASDLEQFLPATLELTLAASIGFVVLGVMIGLASATTKRRFVESVLEIVSLLGIAVPAYWLALAIQLAFYRYLGWLPSGGRLNPVSIPPATFTGLYVVDSVIAGNMAALWDAMRHLALPASAIAIGRMSILARLMKSGITEVQQRQFVVTARAKGLSPRRVLWRHVFKNALNPVVSALGLNIGYALGGQLLVEVIFSWPGLGRYAVDSIQAFDYPAVVAVALLMLVVFSLINLAVDLTYPLLDPRVAFE